MPSVVLHDSPTAVEFAFASGEKKEGMGRNKRGGVFAVCYIRMTECNPDQLKLVSHRRLDPQLLFPIIKEILRLIPYMLRLSCKAFEVQTAAFPENCEIL